MGGISDPLANFGPAAKAKYILLGSSVNLIDRLRSLNLEHVSPARLKGSGISRRLTSVSAEEVIKLALVRRWFFARKPDAGFLLTEFPATLLQAKVFDEWLEVRNEVLSGALIASSGFEAVADHYRSLGLIIEVSDLAA